MNDDDKFCSQCGTRRAIIPTDSDAASAPTPLSLAGAAAQRNSSVPVRPVRSTAEIMPMRVPRTAAPPPPPRSAVQEQPEEPRPSQSVVPWPAEQSASPGLFSTSESPRCQRTRDGKAGGARVPCLQDLPARAAEEPAAVGYTSVPFAAAPGSAEVSPRRSKMSPVLVGAIIVALLAVGGIVWMLRSSMSLGAKPAAKVEITIFPATAKVAVGKPIDFAATVTGAPTSEVTWKVEEGDDVGKIQTRGAYAKEGAISLYATYTAPKTPGTYHLVATSTADPSKSASSEITVVGK